MDARGRGSPFDRLGYPAAHCTFQPAFTDEPQLVRHARVIVARWLEGQTYEQISKELDLNEYHVENCARICRLMEAAGMAEPYRRLTEKPDHVP